MLPYDYYNYYYDPYFFTRPPQLVPHMLPVATIQQQISLGRTGHFFRSFVTGFGQIKFQLLGLNPVTGMVQINIVNPFGGYQFAEVHNNDFVGLIYLGPTP
ncbi:hypothetical protein [Paenibacillus oleatilyticus]|uniref:hypothetical protein n=1 Tax=Paenibacillus oleatilyticus TaxID=2594886 RepID=UPI001C1FC0DC|nr:hypothetical protein [Paenibacillus oleatilyticus]MBU7316121.1 hypothetical protein [Paenibacillus oleatilyticus]